jgi:hypothetical protein
VCYFLAGTLTVVYLAIAARSHNITTSACINIK